MYYFSILALLHVADDYFTTLKLISTPTSCNIYVNKINSLLFNNFIYIPDQQDVLIIQ